MKKKMLGMWRCCSRWVAESWAWCRSRHFVISNVRVVGASMKGHVRRGGAEPGVARPARPTEALFAAWAQRLRRWKVLESSAAYPGVCGDLMEQWGFREQVETQYIPFSHTIFFRSLKCLSGPLRSLLIKRYESSLWEFKFLCFLVTNLKIVSLDVHAI